MKIKMKDVAQRVATAFKSRVTFCNIAEGTHAGAITMAADENIESQNLVVTAGSSEGSFAIANVTSKPIGVCVDQGVEGDMLAVALPASNGSTLVCKAASDVSAGDSVYTAANGKVSAIAGNGAYKVGVALCSATTGGVVEIDPQGFGESAWQFHSCGIFDWDNATNSSEMDCMNISANDVVIANIHTSAGSEKNVKAEASANKITFKLDANGTASTTKIAWIAIRKN